MTITIMTDPIETHADLDLAIGYIEQARGLLLPLRLPVSAECCYLTSTLARLRALRAETWKELPPPPDPHGMNGPRAARAARGVSALAIASGADQKDALAQQLADIMHWCDRSGVAFRDALAWAEDYYATETRGDDSTN
jgi:hypothetical protein